MVHTLCKWDFLLKLSKYRSENRRHFSKDLGHPKRGYPEYQLGNQSEQNFAHVKTALLSWHVQNLLVIGFEFWKNFELRHPDS